MGNIGKPSRLGNLDVYLDLAQAVRDHHITPGFHSLLGLSLVHVETLASWLSHCDEGGRPRDRPLLSPTLGMLRNVMVHPAPNLQTSDYWSRHSHRHFAIGNASFQPPLVAGISMASGIQNRRPVAAASVPGHCTTASRHLLGQIDGYGTIIT